MKNYSSSGLVIKIIYIILMVLLNVSCRLRAANPLNIENSSPIVSTQSETGRKTPLSATDWTENEFSLPICDTEEWAVQASIPISNLVEIDGVAPLDWMPSGDRLTFVQKGAVWVSSAPKYEAEEFIHLKDGTIVQAIWSPDGSHLALYGGQPELQRDSIWIVDPDSNITDLFNTNTLMDEIRGKTINQWLDEHTLTFNVHRGTGVQDLWQVDILTQEAKPLVNIDDNLNLQDVPQGGLYYFSPTNSNQVVIDHAATRHLALLNLETSEAIWLSHPGALLLQKFMDWNQDGTAFLYSQWQSDESTQAQELFLWNIAEQKPVKLLEYILGASWSPAGKSIAFWQEANVQAAVGELSLSTGLIDYYKTGKQNFSDNTTGETKGGVFWSPDGAFLAYTWNGDELWIVSRHAHCQSQPFDTLLQVKDIRWSPIDDRLAILLPDQLFILQHR